MYGKKVYGHKAKIFQLDRQYSDKEKVRKKFLCDYKIIYLRRKNIFRQALSGKISQLRQKWHDTNLSPLIGKKFVIDPDELIQKIDQLEKFQQREKEALEGLDYLFVSYEDDLLDAEYHQKTLDKIFKYLGVESVPVSTNYVRTTTDRISDFVENYEEVVEAVKNSEYAVFLDS